jgi:hypothetical protein
MGIGTLLIGLALLIVVVTLIVLPLLVQQRPAVEPPSPRETLEAERAAVVRAIRELDFDYRTHKLAEEDYKTLRAAQVQYGAQLLRELDALKAATGAGDNRVKADVDAEIEAQVAALRRGGATCPSCSAAVQPDDRFCPRCGSALQETDKKDERPRTEVAS